MQTVEPCVLVVDDEQDVRDSLCEVVEMGGCHARGAANGAEALQILAEYRPCLIVVDLMMPVMTGHEFIDAVRNQPELARVPLVVCTSAPATAPAGVAVLAKPVDIDALWAWMRQHCNCVPVPANNS